uniref:T-box domain-containing protein n=1 Tax=Periophthalmus magnuspinnatus TaxID=409849 RepID=A0A3B4B1N7_9GOBI
GLEVCPPFQCNGADAKWPYSVSNMSVRRTPPTGEGFQHSSIRINLENSDLWKSFHNVGTEMIITKHGRRMFPHCSVSLSGLQPFANYVIMVDMIPVDGYKYKWKKEQWEVAGKAEPQPPCRTYVHPDSPAPGSHWLKQSLSFLKLKLTNNTLDQHGHVSIIFTPIKCVTSVIIIKRLF